MEKNLLNWLHATWYLKLLQVLILDVHFLEQSVKCIDTLISDYYTHKKYRYNILLPIHIHVNEFIQ